MFNHQIKTIIGLDLSLTRTGVCLFFPEDQGVSASHIKSAQKGLLRLAELENNLKNIIYPFSSNCLVVIEDYAFSRNGRNLFGMIEWGGVARLALHKMGVQAITISPTALKKFVTGKGNAQKDMMMQQILKRWGFEASNNDEADAYALARVGDSIINPDRYTKEQMKSALTFKNL